MPVFSTAGSKIYIGGARSQQAADFVASDFTSETWVEIGETEALGSFGDTAQEVTIDTINRQRTRRAKGTRSAGTMEITCGLDYSDTGQLAALAAEATSNDYAFKVEFNDAPDGGTPSERLFIAQVGEASETLDTANSITKLNLQLWINSNLVRVAAAGP